MLLKHFYNSLRKDNQLLGVNWSLVLFFIKEHIFLYVLCLRTVFLLLYTKSQKSCFVGGYFSSIIHFRENIPLKIGEK